MARGSYGSLDVPMECSSCRSLDGSSSLNILPLNVTHNLNVASVFIGNMPTRQRVQKRLAILTKRTRGGCSCMSLLLAVIIIVILAVVIWLLVKYL